MYKYMNQEMDMNRDTEMDKNTEMNMNTHIEIGTEMEIEHNHDDQQDIKMNMNMIMKIFIYHSGCLNTYDAIHL